MDVNCRTCLPPNQLHFHIIIIAIILIIMIRMRMMTMVWWWYWNQSCLMEVIGRRAHFSSQIGSEVAPPVKQIFRAHFTFLWKTSKLTFPSCTSSQTNFLRISHFYGKPPNQHYLTSVSRTTFPHIANGNVYISFKSLIVKKNYINLWKKWNTK